MSPLEIVAILAVTAYAVWRQTQVNEVKRQGRFKLALVYAGIGLAVGGFALPQGALGYGILTASLLLSAVVGVARGRLTRVWLDAEGRVLRQGTALTVALFLGLIAVKFALGTFAYVENVRDGAGFAEVMVMIAIMVAVQAELVWRRGHALQERTQHLSAVLAR